MLVQFLAMIKHRFNTFLHIMANVNLNCLTSSDNNSDTEETEDNSKNKDSIFTINESLSKNGNYYLIEILK